MFKLVFKYYLRTGLFYKYHVIGIPLLLNFYFKSELMPISLGIILLADEFALSSEKGRNRFVISIQMPNPMRLLLLLNFSGLLFGLLWLSIIMLVGVFFLGKHFDFGVLFEMTFSSFLAMTVGNAISFLGRCNRSMRVILFIIIYLITAELLFNLIGYFQVCIPILLVYLSHFILLTKRIL